MDYLHSIFIPHLRGNGLINDDIELSTDLFTPITTILAITVNLTLLGTAIRYRKRHPVLSFSILWFYGGHLLESTFTSLELYFEHRNYMPMIGPIFGALYYLINLADLTDKQSVKRLVAAIPVLLIAFSGFLTHQSATIWSDPGVLFKVWAMEHPGSLRAQRTYGQYLGFNNQPELAIQAIDSTYRQFPHDVSLPLEIINIGCRYNLEVPYAIKDIESLIPIARYSDGILPITKTLVDSIVTKKCSRYDIHDAITLISYLEKTAKLKNHGRVYAKLLFLQSDLHVLAGQLSPAIDLLDIVYKYQPLPTAPLRQATLLASAGLYEEALQYIILAKEADKFKRRFQPSEMENILKWEKMINNAISEKLS